MHTPNPPITDTASARQYLRDLIQHIGPGFHPDTPAADYITPSGEQLFDDATSRLVDADLDHVFTILGDTEPYDFGLTSVRKMLAYR